MDAEHTSILFFNLILPTFHLFLYFHTLSHVTLKDMESYIFKWGEFQETLRLNFGKL